VGWAPRAAARRLGLGSPRGRRLRRDPLDERLERLRREIELECPASGGRSGLSREERWLLFIRWFCWTSFWQVTLLVLVPLPRLLP
jgi:hypothetical protein